MKPKKTIFHSFNVNYASMFIIFLASANLLTTVSNTCCEAQVYIQPSLITGEPGLNNIKANLKTKWEEISSVDGVVLS